MTQSKKSSNFTLGEEWGKSNTFGVSIASDIEVEDVNIRFGDIQILSNISLALSIKLHLFFLYSYYKNNLFLISFFYAITNQRGIRN